MIEGQLVAICGAEFVDVGDEVSDDWSHDETLGIEPVHPLAVARPATTDEVVAIVQAAAKLGVPITARGSGTGLSGASVASRPPWKAPAAATRSGKFPAAFSARPPPMQ